MQSNLINVDIKGSRATIGLTIVPFKVRRVCFLMFYFYFLLLCNKEVISSKCQVISSNVCDMPCFYSFLAGWWSKKQCNKGLFPGRPNIKYMFFN